MRIPFLRPRPAALSQLVTELRAIEGSGVYSNYGPVNSRLEEALTNRLFGGLGGCLTVNCATTGLILAIRDAAKSSSERKFALMPSFTFAATAHAAIWAGLTPLFCDINPETWTMRECDVEGLLESYRERISCIVPYATFGNCVDLDFYDQLASKYDVGVVIDAAASLGSVDQQGRGFGAGFPHAVVYSMHATKLFATAEAGVIHCGDADRLARLRAMGNFGFGSSRVTTMPGLNSKLSEVGALLGLAKLDHFKDVVASRLTLADSYKAHLPGFTFQRVVGQRIAYGFLPVLLPAALSGQRSELVAAMSRQGIGVRHYFSPHLAEHPFFATLCQTSNLTVTQDISDRILSLPMSDTMTNEEVGIVCATLLNALEFVA
jgi:dTDP-4-amino-4,6-dideoxygalactose transaminase